MKVWRHAGQGCHDASIVHSSQAPAPPACHAIVPGAPATLMLGSHVCFQKVGARGKEWEAKEDARALKGGRF